MKKSEWLLAIIIMAMGLMCMMVSANSFGGMSLVQFGRDAGKFCIYIMALIGIIIVIYFLIVKRGKR
ncbi:ABC-type cobalt transport system substrate-binding protein [Paenibacillus anaericanus]|uniref:hypothetical protein n=1 Tax=Paenibacillus anaericanus TaxID=170367 RepID=UPI00278B0FC0|nr:hypothetical protein [Paenibacillus anaericanus]MDQ0089114.1 ABC-type cobalt transport system substrate-binding protein [Paenibacillus anaericanus]